MSIFDTHRLCGGEEEEAAQNHMSPGGNSVRQLEALPSEQPLKSSMEFLSLKRLCESKKYLKWWRMNILRRLAK